MKKRGRKELCEGFEPIGQRIVSSVPLLYNQLDKAKQWRKQF